MYDKLPMEGPRLGAPAMPSSPIENALAELGKTLSDLEESVSRLHARASKVAVPPKPMPCTEGKDSDTGPHSETWHGITEARQRISSISADIRELTSRLET